MQYQGHNNCAKVFKDMMAAVERGYTRILTYAQDKPAVVFDSVLARGYFTDEEGEGSQVFMANGSRLHIAYLGKPKKYKLSEEKKAELVLRADKAVHSGYSRNELVGTLVAIRRCKNGNIQLLMLAANRDNVKDGVIEPGTLALDSISISDIPGEGGRIAALGLGQFLGLEPYQIQTLLDEERLAMEREVTAYEEANPVVKEKRLAREARRLAKEAAATTESHLPDATPTETPAPAPAPRDEASK